MNRGNGRFFPGLKPCATMSVGPKALLRRNAVGMAARPGPKFIPLVLENKQTRSKIP